MREKFFALYRRWFTLAGRDSAWRERYALRHGHTYPGHVPPRPMPASMSPISLVDRAARFQRGLEVIDSLSPTCLRMLVEDGRILSDVASRVKPQPPRPRHHTMFIVADEAIGSGDVIHLHAHADGSFVARRRDSIASRGGRP